ncbi:MAG: hypothetical protein AB1414_19175 [bacterium]
MADQDLKQIDRNILDRLADYCKYLYEEEKERTERIEKKVNIFAIALGGSLIGVLLKFPIWKAYSEINVDDNQGVLITILVITSIILFLLSSLFSFFVYKVRKFERLTDPKKMAEKTILMENESDILSTIIADYTIATNRNHEINNKKVRHLSYALLSLFVALILFITSLLILNISAGWNGGD